MITRLLVACMAVCIALTVLRLTIPQSNLLNSYLPLGDELAVVPYVSSLQPNEKYSDQPSFVINTPSNLERPQFDQLHQNEPQLTAQIPLFRSVSPSDDKDIHKTHWCVIGRHSSGKAARRFFIHFPHAAELLLPCWSWWRRRHAEKRCGLVLLDQMYIPRGSWQDQLVRKWGCRTKFFSDYGIPNRTHPFEDPNGLFFTPILKWMQPRWGHINYIERSEDAWELRRLFVADDHIRQMKGNTLQIGIIQRPGPGRVITNLPDIIQEVRRKLPRANIIVSDLKDFKIRQQAEWFSTKDIIIGAHGAALLNCLFILPHTIVMQLYPHGYFFQSLEPLIESVGGIALDWYNGTDPVYDWTIMKREAKQNEMRESNITAPVNEVVDPILMIMGEMKTPSGWRNDVGVDTSWSKVLQWMD